LLRQQFRETSYATRPDCSVSRCHLPRRTMIDTLASTAMPARGLFRQGLGHWRITAGLGQVRLVCAVFGGTPPRWHQSPRLGHLPDVDGRTLMIPQPVCPVVTRRRTLQSVAKKASVALSLRLYAVLLIPT
jgi:hypothetical protein